MPTADTTRTEATDGSVEAMAPTDLSVCIPYYEELDYLRHCLTSVPYPLADYRIEVIVVDDASQRPCAPALREEFPHVRVIRTAENLGFAGAVNVAARAASGRYLLLLNADTKVLDGIGETIAYLDDNADVGAVGPRLLNPDGSFQPQCRRGRLTPISAFGYFTGLDRRFPRGRLGEYLEPWRAETTVQDVAALSGACMMVPRDVYRAMGGLCEDFVMYGEDLDFCYRLADAGWRVVYSPRANVVHAGGKGGTARRFYRSRMLYWRALWLVFKRHRSTRAFAAYGWLLRIILSLAFLGSVLSRPLGRNQVGSDKPGAEIAPERWPSAAPTLSPQHDS